MSHRAFLAVPGDLTTPTGGYAYARRLLELSAASGAGLGHLALPGGFPAPNDEALEGAARAFASVPPGRPVIVDGLALGALPGAALGALRGPLIALVHHPLYLESGLEPARAAALRASETAALGAARAVVATSHATADCLVAEIGVPRARIAVALPGIDRPAGPAQGSGGPEVQILSVGSLVPRKGHDLLIAALAALRDLPWRLTVIGADDRDPACAEALRRQIAEAGLSARIRLAGAASDAALAEAYTQADLFALPSRHEGYGMASVEAMAHGLPVLACDAGAVAEATRGGARLVPVDDLAALTEALAELIGSADARHTLAKRGTAATAELPRWEDALAVLMHAVETVEREAAA